MNARYQGVFPVVPTIFDATGALDLDGQRRCLEFMIDAGSQGLCIHANYSEQFALGDDERDLITRATLEHVAGRVPVIVTTSHFSARICAERNRRAQALGAAMVMVMPPYHGATFRVPEAGARVLPRSRRRPRHSADDPGCARERRRAVRVPRVARPRDRRGVVLQDRDGRCRVEAARADRARRRCDRGAVGRREGITLLADLDAGATGAMTGGGYRTGFATSPTRVFRRPSRRSRRAVRALAAADQHENRRSGFLTAKALMREGGVIACDKPRAPWPELPPRCAPACWTRRGSSIRSRCAGGARREAPCIGSPVQRRRALRTGASA